MKKVTKKMLKIGLGATAAYLAVGEVAYEGVMNVALAKKMTEKFHLENKSMMDVLLHAPVYVSAYEWYDALDWEDHVIVGRNGKDIYAYILKQPTYSDKWAFFCHGYCGDPRAEAPFARHFYENGYNILFPHMIGHEHDGGRYCTMGYFDKDMLRDWADAVVLQDEACRIVLHGTSMGAASVMLATGECLPANVKCAVEDCGFTDCRGMFGAQMQNMKLPTFPFLNAMNTVSKLRGNLDIFKCSPLEAVQRSSTPTLFIHGTEDDMVPYTMCEQLYRACSAEKEMFAVPGAVHTAAVAVDECGYYEKVDAFVGKYID